MKVIKPFHVFPVRQTPAVALPEDVSASLSLILMVGESSFTNSAQNGRRQDQMIDFFEARQGSFNFHFPR